MDGGVSRLRSLRPARRRCASSSSYLPASLEDGATAAERPAAAQSLKRGRRVFRFPRLDRLVSLFACVFPGGIVNLVSASLALQLPVKKYGENGQTSSCKPNFPAADPRRAEIPAGKPAEAAVPP